ncbi:hypothetical protein F3Y22_tig00110610pilonHSYRG00758 [Hibiscus syriacus]|uniref:Uncharacterized protein n=1 Tax=Hibiscus syriacus TaxID=106335 RepID=A0A6A3A0P1_HIBSY|nr:hypothetical protein F3Y22_tig00110610pilonHSYRG00758 [Hibiscus syriacus]
MTAKGVGEKAVNHLEKSVSSKFEVTLARQIQAQFQTSGKQALQDALRSSVENYVIPAFEMSCKSMFEQIDVTFQKGLREHTATAHQQFEKSHSSVAAALQVKDYVLGRVLNNVRSHVFDRVAFIMVADIMDVIVVIAGKITPEDHQSSPVAFLLAASSDSGSLSQQPEAHMDPMKELGRMIAEQKYDEAFTAALQGVMFP